MHIDHAALWTRDLDRLEAFYVGYFGAVAGPRYANPRRDFESVFLSFEGGARLELMSLPTLAPHPGGAERVGPAHLAFSAGSEAEVDALTARLAADGVALLDGPRRTGDGYYESVLLDPDGNRVEITA